MNSDRAIGMVDVGFLEKTLSKRLKLEHEPFILAPMAVAAWFARSAQRLNTPILRTYWYDAAYDPKHTKYPAQRMEFEKIGLTPALHVRLGRLVQRPQAWQSALRMAVRKCGWDIEKLKEHFDFRDSFEQKGVDTLMVLDMINLAQQGSYQTLILIAGDADLTEAVRTVQQLGRSVVIAYPQGSKGVADDLLRLADEVVEIGETQLRRMHRDRPGLTSLVPDYEDDEVDSVS